MDIGEHVSPLLGACPLKQGVAISESPAHGWTMKSGVLYSLAPHGHAGATVRVPKVPGSTVLDVRPDGGWIVSMQDEDGQTAHELWPGGNSEQAHPVGSPPDLEMAITATHPASGQSATLAEGDTTAVRRADGSVMRLIPPLDPGVRALRFSNDGRCLLVLTRLHRVFSWDLTMLAAELDANGL